MTTTDPDPRVRRRKHGVLLVEQGQSLAQIAQLSGMRLSVYAPGRSASWRKRVLVCPIACGAKLAQAQ